MKVKIDTKEKMHVITIEEAKLTEILTEELKNILLRYLDEPVKNLVVNLKNVNEVDLIVSETLVSVQQTFYDKNHSCVFCELQPDVSDFLDSHELLEVMNVTPTESEAWDIVQMEEIEREYL